MAKLYFTPAELSKLSVKGLPGSVQRINSLAAREGWRKKTLAGGAKAARRRSGRGGGFEYHYSILPAVTVSDLIEKSVLNSSIIKAPLVPKTTTWQTYEAASQYKKDMAKFRLGVLTAVKDLQRSGMGKTASIEFIRTQHLARWRGGQGDHHKFSRASVFNWLKMVQGKRSSQWLPALMPRQTGGRQVSEIAREIIDLVRADYLRPEKPSFMAVYERIVPAAKANGWEMPSARTLQRRFLKGVPHPVQVLMRDGIDALENMFPPQTRDRTEFHALEAINADGHIWDVFVHDEKGGKPYRPVMCAIQDLYSNKFLGWRIGKTLGADIVRLSFGDVFRNYGIPKLCWLDNGREFASKMVTGGTATRFRFKVKEEEPTGFLTALGVEVHWTRPYRGQSKPIERAFRDFCDHIAKHPKFAGAYTGNKVTNKPSNYGSKSVHIDVFKAVVKAGIEAHNAREGRRTAVCQGRLSFDQVFNASYAVSPIIRATDEQLRQCLLAGEFRKSAKHSGSIKILGNTYWSEEMAQYAGDKFVVRFDPENLHGSVFVYLQNGSFLCEAECWHAEGFADMKAGRDHANKKKAFMKAQKELSKTQVAISVEDVAAFLPDIEPEDIPEPSVIRPAFGMNGNAALKASPDFDFEAMEKNVQFLKHQPESPFNE